jgi:hypothetical protein
VGNLRMHERAWMVSASYPTEFTYAAGEVHLLVRVCSYVDFGISFSGLWPFKLGAPQECPCKDANFPQHCAHMSGWVQL